MIFIACCNGDVNGDHSLDLSDAIFTLNDLFGGGPESVRFACADECSLTAEDCARLASMLPDLEFGRSVAESYLTTWGGGQKALATYSADGTVVISPESQFNVEGIAEELDCGG